MVRDPLYERIAGYIWQKYYMLGPIRGSIRNIGKGTKGDGKENGRRKKECCATQLQ